jgi:hypothetical protein
VDVKEDLVDGLWTRRGSRERMSLEKSRNSRLGVYLFSFDRD